MQILIKKNQHESELEVQPSNPSQFVQHEVFRLTIAFCDENPIQTFALSYIFGHVRIIHRLQLRNGSRRTLDKFLQWWQCHLDRSKQSTPLVRELELCGNMEWDMNFTLWMNALCLRQSHLKHETATLNALVFSMNHDARFDVAGLKVTDLETLEIPLRSRQAMYSLAQALHGGCKLRALFIPYLHLARQSPKVLEYFSIRLRQLRNLTSLELHVSAAPPFNAQDLALNAQHLAAAIPSSVQNLKVSWHLCDLDGLNPLDALSPMAHAPAMVALQKLDLELFGRRLRRVFDPPKLMELLVQILRPCRELQHLRLSAVWNVAKAQELCPLLSLLSTWTTLQHVVLDIPVFLDDSCCQVVNQILQCNHSLTEFEIISERPSRFQNQRLHYLRLNRLQYANTLLIQDKIPLALWPHVLEKASRWHSVVFELLLQKNDLLFSNACVRDDKVL